MALKNGSYKGPHWATRRSLLEMLKVRGELSSLEMAEKIGISSMAVRQHMQELEASGDVTAIDRPRGKGRPTKFWSLTAKANRHFPDKHRDLILDLLGSVENVLGEEALNKLLDERGREQAHYYSSRIGGKGSLAIRVQKLADLRSEEGYMAEVIEDSENTIQLIENHCPICDAASVCQGLCSREKRVFEKVLGPGCQVERVEHLLSGGRRCAYRIHQQA